jgi:hypothetical protein
MLSISVDETAHAVAEAVARAISQKDIAGLDGVYSDDCVIWTNTSIRRSWRKFYRGDLHDT